MNRFARFAAAGLVVVSLFGAACTKEDSTEKALDKQHELELACLNGGGEWHGSVTGCVHESTTSPAPDTSHGVPQSTGGGGSGGGGNGGKTIGEVVFGSPVPVEKAAAQLDLMFARGGYGTDAVCASMSQDGLQPFALAYWDHGDNGAGPGPYLRTRAEAMKAFTYYFSVYCN